MKLRTGPPTPDEVADLLTLRFTLGLDEWESEEQRERALQFLRVLELKHRRTRKSDQERQRWRAMHGLPVPDDWTQ